MSHQTTPSTSPRKARTLRKLNTNSSPFGTNISLEQLFLDAEKEQKPSIDVSTLEPL
jgi:hypothetical protein